MSEEEVTIRRGSYTWHPVYPYLLTLIEDLQGALKINPIPGAKPPGAPVRFMEYEKKLAKLAPRILEMRARGATKKEIARELEIGFSTLSKYLKDIREWGLGKC